MSNPSRRRHGAIQDVQLSAEWTNGTDQGVYYQDYQGHDLQYMYAQGQTPVYGIPAQDLGHYGYTGQLLPFSTAPEQHIYSSTTAHQTYDHPQLHTPVDPSPASLDGSVSSTDMSDPVYTGKFEEEPLPDLEEYKREDGQYYCNEGGCSGAYNSLRNFKKHMRTHFKPVICPLSELCDNDGNPKGRRTAEQRDMIRHVRAYHSAWAKRQQNLPQDDFPCDLCEKTFTRKDNLRKHTKEIHEKKA
ncbi:hypothetical protein GGTG_03860 [Gaeumannomyces tritici R3-111a-1]|uniref:C2H2-type domain-containing protein n=1 Tax=Gaeumannomyces tritici (strain R3-111a-1) TaxID=644352 RepID=J3NRF6_GAET3|nr:hypothetical protein GGTG_03860 [Gaeumannomyces tritici R3-111a-1]EJT78762.1 hypothetical protein GGTG_03860 [Gaeumannomyces tritici R3-111a-1]